MSTDLIAAKTRGMVAQFRGGQILLAVTVLLTVALLLWVHWLSHDGSTHGLTPIFFLLFAVGDYAAFKCALLIVLAAALMPNRCRTTPLLQWLGSNPGWIAAGTVGLLSCGAWAGNRRRNDSRQLSATASCVRGPIRLGLVGRQALAAAAAA